MIILDLLATFIIHPLPLIIYRFAIKKEPIPPQKALIIVIVDGVIVFAIWIALILLLGTISALSVTPIFFWAIICKIILSKGYVAPEEKENTQNEKNIEQ